MQHFRARALLWALAAMLARGPAPASVAAAADSPYDTIRSLVYVDRKEQPLRADVYRPTGKGPFPGVLCVHGGAWIAGNRSQVAGIAQTLAAHGYTAVAIDYRLAPQHQFPAQIEDCRAALQWMLQNAGPYKINPTRVAAWGYSAGGQLVALLGLTSAPAEAEHSAAGSNRGPWRLQAVVAGGAPCDFRQIPPDSPRLAYWLGGTRREKPEAYESASPARFVSPRALPIFFYHGEQDQLVEIGQPTAMMDRLKAAGVPAAMYVVPGAGHIRAFQDPTAIAKGIEFLNRYLSP